MDGFTSLAVLLVVLGSWVGWPILDPLVGSGITHRDPHRPGCGALGLEPRLINGIEPAIVGENEHAAMHVPGVERAPSPGALGGPQGFHGSGDRSPSRSSGKPCS